MRGAFVAILAGCYHPTAATGVPCALNGDCPGDQKCDFGHNPPICVGPLFDAGVDVPIDAPACQTSATCPPGAPICDPTTLTCRGCIADVECGDVGACTEYNGACIGDADTIYVAMMGIDSGTCTATTQCATVDYALSQVMGTRRTIRLDDGNYPGVPGSPAITMSVTGGPVVISGVRLDFANGPMLSASSNGLTNPQVVTTGGGTELVLEGLTLANGGNDAIRSSGALTLSHVDVEANAGRGVNATPQNQAQTRIWSSRIYGNNSEGVFCSGGPLEVLRTQVIHNNNGGIDARQGAVAIISTIVAHNGSNSQYGGILLQNLGGVAPVLEFDTIAYNSMKNASNAAPAVLADTSAAIAIADSIVYGNIAGTNLAPPQICTTCSATYSLFSGNVPPGSNNIGGNPGFVNMTADDYHIDSSSAAHGAADPNADVHFDVDGEPRPQGLFDIGADEIP